MDKPSSKVADSRVGGAAGSLKGKCKTKQECREELSRRLADQLALRIQGCDRIGDRELFKRLQDLNMDMNIYQPGYKNVLKSDVWRVFLKLRRLKGSREVVLEDIFAALDTHGTGKVSSHAFIAALMGPIGLYAALTSEDIETIVHYFVDRSTNRIDYRAFMDFIEQPEPKGYEFPLVETEPTLIPHRHGTTADKVELQALNSVMDYIASVMLYKRLHLEAYLRESEPVMKSRHITIPQLKKVFEHMGIYLDDRDFNLICKWFARNAIQISTTMLLAHLNDAIDRVATSGTFNPSEVSKKVDKQHYNEFPKIDLLDLRAYDIRELFRHCDSHHGSQDHFWERSEDLADLITRLQRTIHVNHIIPRPRFQQYDHLNTGRITIDQFRKALDQCRINIGGYSKVFVTPRELQLLTEFYSESYEPGFVMWRAFVQDIESGKCLRDLHRHPSIDMSDHLPYGPLQSVRDLPCKYSRRKAMSLVEHRRTERILEFVKHQLYNSDLYQFFRAFDKENRRHVTRNQFREIMRMTNVLLREQDAYDLELYFIDYHGFCYMFFLQVLGSAYPPREVVPVENERETPDEGSSRVCGNPPYESEGSTGQEVLDKIKNIVFDRFLRLKYWFEPFDKLNTGVMDEVTFIRALTAAYSWRFTCAEYRKLMDLFRRPLDPKKIEYRKFLSTIDELYTQPNLELSPLLQPVPYLGKKERVQNFSKHDWEELGNAMNKVVKQGVCLDNIYEFRSVDRLNRRTVVRSDYLRTMDTLGALKYLSEHEQMLIFTAFSRPVHHRMEFDYARFLKACHHVCLPEFTDDL